MKRKNYIHMCVYVCRCMNHFAVHLKLTQCCKSTMLLKKKVPLTLAVSPMSRNFACLIAVS